MILSLLSLYWGALRRVNKNLPSLTVLVVDFDSKIAPYTSSTPIVGPVVTKAAQMQNISPMPHLGFIVKEPADYNNDPMEVRRAIYHQHHWVGIIVNPNATALLEDAVSQGNSSYDPNGVGQIIYVEARDQSTIDECMFILQRHISTGFRILIGRTDMLPLINELTVQVTAQFGMMWAQQVTSRMSNDTIRGNIRSTPQALNPAIGFTTYNLRPFQPPVATPAVTIGLICELLFCALSPIYSPRIRYICIPKYWLYRLTGRDPRSDHLLVLLILILSTNPHGADPAQRTQATEVQSVDPLAHRYDHRRLLLLLAVLLADLARISCAVLARTWARD